MQPVLLELGPVTVYSYGVFAALAFAVGIYIVRWLSAVDGLSRKHFLDYCIYVAIAGLVGARLWYVAFRPDEVTSFLNFFTLGGGGLAWPGGVLLAGIVLVLALRRNKEPVWKWLDIVAIGTVAGLAVGKIGSFLNGDGFGIGSDLPWAIEYADQFAPGAVVGAPVHPIQLYAAVLFAALAYILLRLHRNRIKEPGHVFWLGLGGISFISLILEPLHASIDALTFQNGWRVIIPTALILIAVSSIMWIRWQRSPRT
jgi:phosphatidylglycerol---prolipoprotein diacylglyceryl transferase